MLAFVKFISFFRMGDWILFIFWFLWNSYPEKKVESFHHTHCYIPAGLSAVLDHSPGLIAPVVQAFYHRDALDLKVNIIETPEWEKCNLDGRQIVNLDVKLKVVTFDVKFFWYDIRN